MARTRKGRQYQVAMRPLAGAAFSKSKGRPEAAVSLFPMGRTRLSE
jgi:hypothetical protein